MYENAQVWSKMLFVLDEPLSCTCWCLCVKFSSSNKKVLQRIKGAIGGESKKGIALLVYQNSKNKDGKQKLKCDSSTSFSLPFRVWGVCVNNFYGKHLHIKFTIDIG